jgi:hypothetical protein
MERSFYSIRSLAAQVFRNLLSRPPYFVSIKKAGRTGLAILPLLILLGGCLEQHEATDACGGDVDVSSHIGTVGTAHIYIFEEMSARLDPEFANCKDPEINVCDFVRSEHVWLKKGERFLPRWGSVPITIIDCEDADLPESLCERKAWCGEYDCKKPDGSNITFSTVPPMYLVESEFGMSNNKVIEEFDPQAYCPASKYFVPEKDDAGYRLFKPRYTTAAQFEAELDRMENTEVPAAELRVHLVNPGEVGRPYLPEGYLKPFVCQPITAEIEVDGVTQEREIVRFTWQVRESGDGWKVNFSDSLRVGKVRVVDSYGNPIQRLTADGEKVPTRPYRIGAVVGGNPEWHCESNRNNSGESCLADPGTAEGNMDYQNHCIGGDGRPISPMDITPTYLQHEPKARILWIVDFIKYREGGKERTFGTTPGGGGKRYREGDKERPFEAPPPDETGKRMMRIEFEVKAE